MSIKTLLREVTCYYSKQNSNIGLSSLLWALSTPLLRDYYLKKKQTFLTEEMLSSYGYSNEINNKFYSAKSLNEFLIDHFEYKFEHHLLTGE